MKSSKIFAAVAVALLNVVLCTVAVGQDKATAQEVVAKVREAASTLSKTGDWPKPGEKEGSRKLAYGLSAKGTPYVVAAGVYDDKATIAELSKLTNKK